MVLNVEYFRTHTTDLKVEGEINSRKLSGGCGQAREHSWSVCHCRVANVCFKGQQSLLVWRLFGFYSLSLYFYISLYLEYWRSLCARRVTLGHLLCSFFSLFTSSAVFEPFTPFHTDSQPVHDLCEVPSFQRAHSWENSPCSYQSVRLLRARLVPVSL